MAKRTTEDLQRMKGEGRKIAAAVVYDYQVARICAFAGIDVLSVGDSLGRNVLGQLDVDDCTVDDMLPFARAVVRARDVQAALGIPERPGPLVSVDIPTVPSRSGPKEVAKAAKRFKETGVDMCKIDIRTREEELFDEVQAVIDAGLGAYPQIGFEYVYMGELHGAPEEREHVMKWAERLQEAGASMIDLTMVTPEVYADVCRSVRIPLIGGQAPPEADGKIQVTFGTVGMGAGNMDRPDDTPARDFYQRMKKIIDSIRSGKWDSRQFAGV